MPAKYYAMIVRFSIIWFLLCFDVHADDRRTQRNVFDTRSCDFSGAQKNYSATDLLRCIDKLTLDLAGEESRRSTSTNDEWNRSPYGDVSLGSILTNLFNENPLTLHQTPSFPPDTTSGYYQSNYQAISGGTFDLSTGIGQNLFDALSSISRYDDYKCVPRILCEMASGKFPGRSLGKRTSDFLQSLGRNPFMEWLTKFDIARTSPLLNFARAMILGYSNKGHSTACYRAFPKCPTDRGGLVYYLNNHNGGFFRLFNRIQAGNYRESKPFYSQRDAEFISNGQETIIPGISKEADRTGPSNVKPNFPISRGYKSSKESIFPNDPQEDYKNRIVFPDEKELSNLSVINRISKYAKNYETERSVDEHLPFFPEITRKGNEEY